jgi:hypothetical protein
MIKILGKIELPPEPPRHKPEKRMPREEIVKNLDRATMQTVDRLQERIRTFEGAPHNFLTQDGQVHMSAFEIAHGKDTVDFDTENVFQQKRGFYNSYKPEVQEQYGTTDEKIIVEKIEQENKKRDGALFEQGLFVFLNKALDKRYMAVRSSDHDDYLNKTDLLLIDTHTGETICAFDQTVEGANSRLSQKVAYAKKTLLKGRGMHVKYGCVIKNNTMSLQSLQNVPPLFLPIAKTDLESFIQQDNLTSIGDLSPIEKTIIQSLYDSLKSQISELEHLGGDQVSYRAVKDFVQSLER